jgi:hypothetical protein
MPDSQNSEANATVGEIAREPRFDAVVRWVEYIQNNPPEVWGPQQNAVVDGQIDSAAAVDRSPEEIRKIRSFADDVLAEREESSEE